MSTYNGHKNYNHWNVSLWINSDEGLYSMARHCIRSSKDRNTAAERMLLTLQMANEYVTPDGVRYSKASIRSAMVGM